MDLIEITGYAAAFLTMVCNIPQAVKIIRTKDTKSVSAVTYSLLLGGLILWVIYGCMRSDLPVIICNSVSALFCGMVLFLKLSSAKVVDQIHNTINDKNQ
jgi:MtN3 and saliva related transmembrane protein